jgi:hypothetical protein
MQLLRMILHPSKGTGRTRLKAGMLLCALLGALFSLYAVVERYSTNALRLELLELSQMTIDEARTQKNLPRLTDAYTLRSIEVQIELLESISESASIENPYVFRLMLYTTLNLWEREYRHDQGQLGPYTAWYLKNPTGLPDFWQSQDLGRRLHGVASKLIASYNGPDLSPLTSGGILAFLSDQRLIEDWSKKVSDDDGRSKIFDRLLRESQSASNP